MNIHNLKEGDFFITSDNKSGKVLEVLNTTIKSDNLGSVYKDSIVEFNSHISNLVKEGDYVNGFPVYTSNGSLYVNNQPLTSVKVNHFITKQEFQRTGYNLNQVSLPELWKDIEGFPSYEISSKGRVRTKKAWKIMSYLSDRAQLSVRIVSPDGVRRRKSIAVMVLEAFKGRQDGCIPKFIDGDPSNCKLENLEWESRTEQAKRILPKRKQIDSQFKYQYIVGFFDNKPIIHALNTRELSNFIKTYCREADGLQLSHLSRNISKARPYKGILFKCVSPEEFTEISNSVQNADFIKIFREQIVNSNIINLQKRAKAQKIDLNVKPSIPKPKINSIKTHSKLDDIDDAEFYREQEEIERRKRQEFKDKLMALLRQYNNE